MVATFVPWLHTPKQGDSYGWMGKGTLSLGLFAVVLFVVCLPRHSWLFVSGLGGAATAWAVLFVLTAARTDGTGTRRGSNWARAFSGRRLWGPDLRSGWVGGADGQVIVFPTSPRGGGIVTGRLLTGAGQDPVHMIRLLVANLLTPVQALILPESSCRPVVNSV